jgi:hypothetical protein
MPKRTPSAIAVGTGFSPDLISLPEFLQALCSHSGYHAALQKAIWSPPVHKKRTSVPTSARTANLPLEAAIQYGLLEPRTYRVTPFAQALASVPPPHVYEDFARHILQQCGGLRVVEAAEQMKIDGYRTITGDSLALYLTKQGFPVSVHNTAINSMRMWLAEVGIFTPKRRGWNVDQAAKERVLGITNKAASILADLSREEAAFVEALCRINPQGWCRASDVRANAEAYSNISNGRQNLRDILEPLKSAGLIDYKSGGTRGGKSALLKTMPAFNANVLDPFVRDTVKTLDPTLSAYYRRRPADIYADLASRDTMKEGLALEAYAVHIMRLLGLRFLGWRKRARETTGRAEVDILLTGLFGGVPTRWQVQCKNTPSGRVDLEDVAKEIGLLPITNATHVMLIGNCPITPHARDFAERVMQSSPVTIFLLDKNNFARIKDSPGSIGLILQAQSEEIQWRLHRAQGTVWSL